MSIKQELYNQCLEFVEKHFNTIQSTIYEIQESLTSETKSSAGDKHETGRAMLQLEREKAGNQLAEINKVKQALTKISLNKSATTIGLGSVVYAAGANYFIAISAGEFLINNKKFYTISPSTPIGRLLIGKTIGDEITFKNNRINIIKIL